ncbi:MAG: hypothetical protein MUF50_05030 [Planctomycetes bacterium]|nr:hypothetical protein [Planctomycetota bacterium]
MSLVQFVLNITQNMGYGGIVFLMALESSLFPLPSEIVIPPAAYLAQQGVMNLWLIIIAGTIGSVLGASFNYCLGYFLGRPLFYKLANYRWARYILFITPDKDKLICACPSTDGITNPVTETASVNGYIKGAPISIFSDSNCAFVITIRPESASAVCSILLLHDITIKAKKNAIIIFFFILLFVYFE